MSSPILPEIPSDDEEYLRKFGKNDKSRPTWAATPNLKLALLEQQSLPTDHIFDKIQPVRLEGIQSKINVDSTVFLDIFKNKTFKRGRNSTIPFM